MKKIVLASASPRRRELLTQVGVRFQVTASQGEEKLSSSVPEEAVKELALQKAGQVAARVEADVVIGADTVVAARGRILGKPKSREQALEMLRLLQGGAHQVYTGVAVLLPGREPISFAEETTVHVYPMTEAQMEAYVDTGEPMDKAGAYGIQGRFAAYISGIEGDYNNVVGLPVGRLCHELRKVGIDLVADAMEEKA